MRWPHASISSLVLAPITRALAVLEIEDVGRLASGGEARPLAGRASLGVGAWATAPG